MLAPGGTTLPVPLLSLTLPTHFFFLPLKVRLYHCLVPVQGKEATHESPPSHRDVHGTSFDASVALHARVPNQATPPHILPTVLSTYGGIVQVER